MRCGPSGFVQVSSDDVHLVGVRRKVVTILFKLRNGSLGLDS